MEKHVTFTTKTSTYKLEYFEGKAYITFCPVMGAWLMGVKDIQKLIQDLQDISTVIKTEV